LLWAQFIGGYSFRSAYKNANKQIAVSTRVVFSQPRPTHVNAIALMPPKIKEAITNTKRIFTNDFISTLVCPTTSIDAHGEVFELSLTPHESKINIRILLLLLLLVNFSHIFS
jgi:hypothetical protein